MRAAGVLARIMGINSKAPECTRLLVFRVKEASEAKDARLSRIIELADGKSVGEILEVLYWDEVRTGAWLADIGLWRDLFYRDVAKAIGELVTLGYIRLEMSRGQEAGVDCDSKSSVETSRRGG